MAISFSNNIKIQPITYQEFINSEYIPEYGEMVIISDYKQDENGINVPSFTVGDGSTMLKNLKISVDYVPTYTWGEINDKPTFADVATSGSYEDLSDKPSLNYLPLDGGTMSGDIDMNKNSFLNAGFEIVDELPTTNLFVGRKVVMKGIEYTYSGQKWVAQGFSRFQILDTNKSLVSGVTESYLNDVCLFKSTPTYYMYHGQTLGRIVESKKIQYYNALTDSWSNQLGIVYTMKNTGDKMQFTLNDVAPTASYGYITAFESTHVFRGHNVEFLIEYLIFRNLLGDNDTTNLENYSWYPVKKFQSNTNTHFVILPQRSINKTTTKTGESIIGDVRVTLTVLSEASNALIQTTSFKFYISKRYDIGEFPQNINYDAIIEPTQTGTVEKGTNKVLQYLTQGVNWLKNKISTLYTKPSTGIPSTDLASDIQVSLGKADTSYSWGNHADAGYAKLDETGKVPTSQLPSYTEPIQITHEELKTLRDSRELIKGAKYEITDYKTIINGNSLLDLSLESVKNSLGLNETISWATGITASTDERVLFNIIVTATDVDTLDANAIAIYDSERGSDYLSQAKVSQWELKYDLDNNTTKYAWASENGYGVIYYMKDEWGNECPYDFKSITFINTAGNAISDIAANKQYYTFTVTLNDGTLTDMSVPIKGENYSYLNISSNSQCLFNKISPCIGNLDGYNKLYLNNNIFHNVDGGICIYNIYHNSSFHNYYYNNCSNNTMHGKYYANIHGADCSNNKFAGVTWGNTFKDWASWSTFGDAFMKNTIGEYSYYNTFADYVYNNTIGASSINNTFEQAIQNNTIGSEFVDNYIGQNFTSNTIGNKCKSNVFRGLFQNNTLGNSTSHCDFGVRTTYCKFGNSNDSIITKGHNSQIELGSECGAITFGIDCDMIKFYSNESTNTLKNKVFAVEVGDGNRGLYISSSDSNLDNVNIKRSVITTVGTITDDKILRLTINNTSTKYETIVTRRDNNDIYIGTMDNYYPLITEEDIDLLFN